MKKITKNLISLAILFIGMMYAGSDLYAVDTPHNTSATNLGCTLCHIPVSSAPAWYTSGTYSTGGDNTLINMICNDCHNNAVDSFVTDSAYNEIKTHSAAAIGSSKYGDTWTVECTACHDPHYQRQPRANTTTGYLDSGTITSATTASALVDTGKNWATDQWKNYILVPNTAYPSLFYEIASNTSNTITVRAAQAGINTRYVGTAGSTTYAIKYGKLVSDVVNGSAVKLLGKEGTNSYADNDTTIDGICQVCHTQTQAFNRDGTLEGTAGHQTGVAGTNCIGCHSHKEGFKGGGCENCHGNPPGYNSGTLLTKNKDNGAITSDSRGVGAHNAHKTAGFRCSNCHISGMTSKSTGDNYINIGFYLNANLGGTYGNQSPRTVLPYAASGTTSLLNNNSLQCSNIYCHSSGQGATATDATPYQYSSPTWTTANTTGACETCHPTAAMATGSHSTHLSEDTNCGNCHTDASLASYSSASHVNKLIDVADGYTGAGDPGNGYGTCSAASCHQTGISTNNYKTTPEWGQNAANCTVCHDASPTTGTHTEHIAVTNNCSTCHTNAIKDTSYTDAAHRDGDVDVAIGSYTPNKAYGSAKASCSATTCHGSASPTWGNNTSNSQCVKCHGVNGSSPTDYSNEPRRAAPGYVATVAPTGTGRDTANSTTGSKVGVHDAHLTGSGYGRLVLCTDCHENVLSITTTSHMSGAVDLPWSSLTTSGGVLATSYNSVSGQCSSVYCHGASFAVSTQGTNTRPTWTDTAYLANPATKNSTDCNKCHKSPATTSTHTSANMDINTLCAGCHGHEGTGSSHIDGIFTAAGCTGCHGQPPVDSATMVGGTAVPTQRSTQFALNSGSGAHSFHANKPISCDRCHSSSGGDGGHTTRAKITFGFTYGLSKGTYTAQSFVSSYTLTSGDPGTTVAISGTTRNCTNYCHSSGQAANGQAGDPVFAIADWDTTGPSGSGACGACHATTANTTGSHTKHLAFSTDCGKCHTGASATLYDTTDHVNALIDVASGGSYSAAKSGAPGNGYGECSAATCHQNGTAPSSYVTTSIWGTTLTACTTCHSASPTTGNHAKHIAKYNNCTACHGANALKDTSYNDAAHIDGDVDVPIGGYTTNKAYGSAKASCSNVSCHMDGTSPSSYVTTSIWGSTPTACATCHSASPTTGNHAKHIAKYNNCTACHGANAIKDTSYNDAAHIDGNVDVAIGSYTPNKAYGSTKVSCSSVSCHMDGTSPSSYVTTSVWGSTTTVCTTCHSASPTTGTHTAHISLTGDCDTCHGASAIKDTSYNDAAHIDGDVDVAIGSYTPNKAYGSAKASCSATTCHGSASPTWGNNTSNSQCVKCHGVNGSSPTDYSNEPRRAAPGYVATVAPTGTGRDTAGSTTGSKVGVHDAHLTGSGYGRLVLCTDCHEDVLSITTTSHMSGAVDLPWSSLTTSGGVLATSYNSVSGQCSNVYCHGSSFAVSTQGTNTRPTWTDTTYLTNPATKNSTDCNKCHKSPATTSTHTSQSMTINTLCAGCHGHEGAGSSHIDGIFTANGNCDTCHAYDVVGAVYSGGVWSGGDWNGNSQDGLTPTEGSGAHAKHINHIKTRLGIDYVLIATGQNFGQNDPARVCGVCHTNTGAHDMGGNTTGRLINFGDTHNPGDATAAPYSQYMFGASEPNYNGAPGTSSASQAKTCSNISCHFQMTPVWSSY